MKQISLTKGKFAIVDHEDFPYLNRFKWTYQINQDMAKRDVDKYAIYMQNLIIENHPGCVIKHINGNRLDNRKTNLISTTMNAVVHSRMEIRPRKTSKYKGVFWSKQKRKWQGFIQKEKRYFHLGFFEKENDAGIAYNNKALELYGLDAYQNKIVK